MNEMLTLLQTNLPLNFEVLLPSKKLLMVLALLSVWLWILVVITTMKLRQEKKKLRAAEITPYRKLCDIIRGGPIRQRTQTRLVAINTGKLCHETTGQVTTILILASVAPLLGLLGTVEGMIQCFASLAQMKSIESAQLTAGISKALVTTQGGLLVAIPGIVAGGILQRQAKKFRNQLELAATSGAGGNNS